jgi:peptide deformylase
MLVFFTIMALLKIVKFGDQVLTRAAAPIIRIDDRVQQLASDMVATMHTASGVGLAAPQVGVLDRLIIVDLSCGLKKKDIHILINPEIISATGAIKDKEGCLSFPDLTTYVIRPKKIVVRAADLSGKKLEIEADHLLARAFCHEIDHLAGVCFIERMGNISRRRFLRKIEKLRQNGKW